jgi:hypothetical protein
MRDHSKKSTADELADNNHMSADTRFIFRLNLNVRRRGGAGGGVLSTSTVD